jgi:hypothetical protein
MATITGVVPAVVSLGAVTGEEIPIKRNSYIAAKNNFSCIPSSSMVSPEAFRTIRARTGQNLCALKVGTRLWRIGAIIPIIFAPLYKIL